MEGTDPQDSVKLTLIDNYGNKFTVPVSVKVVDDVPKIDAHIDCGTVAAGSTVNGTVNIAWGADGPAAADSITVNGVAGKTVTNGLAFYLTNGTLLLDSHDVLYGDAGDDFLFGGSGNDHLYGGDGSDHLYGGAGNDFLDGGTSHYDAITNPTGGNVLDGGAGNDILVFHKGDTIDGGDGTDVLLVGGTDTTTVDDLFHSKTSNIEVIIKGDGAESLTDM